MKEEINSGVQFLREFLAKYGQLTALQINQFSHKLTRLLHERYANHWYVTQPMKGQAFRCIRLKQVENYIDPVLEQILRECGLSLSQLGLTNDFTLWIDPGEVSVRFGDQIGYTYTIARFDLLKSADAEPASCTEQVNTEKIFDDKLTAFIRQNSTAVDARKDAEEDTKTSTVGAAQEAAQEDNGDDGGEAIIDAVASLSVAFTPSEDAAGATSSRRLNSSSTISIGGPSINAIGSLNDNEFK